MSVRRSLDPTSSKPYNINIYYNINSKNITNNHEILSHPVTARGLKSTNEDGLNGKKNQSKLKNNSKNRRKKYSVDLGMPTDKRGERGAKKSNTNSICSGFPSQANYKKESERNEEPKKTQNINFNDKNQSKLGQLLQIFSEGKIDKVRLTRQIINIFQLPDKGSEEVREKKINKKKRSLSTLMGTATPKNNQQKLQQGNNNLKAVLNIHKARRRQTRSERGSFSNSKNIILKNQITQKIIECKNVDSSLFLQPDHQEMMPPIVDRTNDVQTSYSIVLLNENIKNERKTLPQSHKVVQKLQHHMAIRIQRAWRKYKTKSLISNFLDPKHKFPTDSNSLLQKLQCVSNKTSMEVQNYLSLQLNRRNAIKQAEIARVEELKDHELKKWNQIMDYVRVSINNKDLSSNQCLSQIIEYFQNAKNAVQKQLLLDKFQVSKRGRQESREFTEFTNKILSKDQFQQDPQQNVHKLLQKDEEDQDSIEEQSEQSQFVGEKKESSDSEAEKRLCLERIIKNSTFYPSVQKSQDLSFEVVQSTLLLHLKKMTSQYEQKIGSLDTNSTEYLENKKKLQIQYQRERKEIKRILANLNKGYTQAKNILEKEELLSYQEISQKSLRSAGNHDILQKCKSDNYLLKTAINYKQYIEKKEKSSQYDPYIDQLGTKPLTKVKQSENLELIKSAQSSQLSGKSLKNLLNGSDNEENVFLGKPSFLSDLNESDSGENIFKNQQKFNRLEQKIFSEEFLQYEEIHKRLEEEEEKDQESLNDRGALFGAEYISLFENSKLNENNKKLKYLTSEDKDDIFEFLFIDLTLELVTECDQDSNVYRSIKKYIEKRKKLQSIPKGIKTSLQACKEYLHALSNLVKAQYLDLLCNHIVVPMAPTAKEMLKYMHEEQYPEKSQSNDDDYSVSLILPVQIFEKFSASICPQYNRIYEDEAKEMSRVNFLKSADHVHQKALFDCLNECLDGERPFGFLGKPFPWKTTCKNRRNIDWSRSQRLQKMQNGVEKVIQCCSYMCGILADKQESVFGNHKVSENYVHQIREDRMSRMLANDLIESEQKWSFFDDEETETAIELSRSIQLFLITQMAKELTFL